MTVMNNSQYAARVLLEYNLKDLSEDDAGRMAEMVIESGHAAEVIIRCPLFRQLPPASWIWLATRIHNGYHAACALVETSRTRELPQAAWESLADIVDTADLADYVLSEAPAGRLSPHCLQKLETVMSEHDYDEQHWVVQRVSTAAAQMLDEVSEHITPSLKNKLVGLIVAEVDAEHVLKQCFHHLTRKQVSRLLRLIEWDYLAQEVLCKLMPYLKPAERHRLADKITGSFYAKRAIECPGVAEGLAKADRERLQCLANEEDGDE